MVKVKRSSIFLHRVQDLKDRQWEDIIMAAEEYCKKAGKQVVADANGRDLEPSSSADDELFDPEYDE